MRPLPLLRAFALPAVALLASGACSLMAPSDEELLGNAARSSSSKAGNGGAGGIPGGGGPGPLGGAGGDSGVPSPGGSDSGLGGESDGDLSSLIPPHGGATSRP